MGTVGRSKVVLGLAVALAVAGGATACGVRVAAGAAASAAPLVDAVTPRWGIEPAPDPAGAGNAALVSVACPTPSDCVAVGSSSSTAGSRVLLERWDGRRWRIERVPAPPLSSSGEVSLQAVSCASAEACVVVGDVPVVDTTTEAFADVWNGRGWRLSVTPVPKGDLGTELSGISCTSADACTAVGDAEYVSDHFSMTATLAESWNGHTWTVERTPDPSVAAGGGNVLDAVSCAARSNCMAVGEEYGSTAGTALAELWDGTTWRIEPPRTPSPGGGLVAVSCTHAGSCTAVGDGTLTPTSRGFAERWGGRSWSLQSTPPVAGGADLSAISCTGEASCVTVGTRSVTAGDGSSTLAEMWNGTTWSVVPTPNAVTGSVGPTTTTPTTGTVVPTDLNSLSSVACTSPTSCTAVGNDVDSDDVGKVLVERYSS